MSHDLHESLRDNVRILGDSLGRTIADLRAADRIEEVDLIDHAEALLREGRRAWHH